MTAEVIPVDFRRRQRVVLYEPSIHWEDVTDIDDALWATLHLHVNAVHRLLDEQTLFLEELQS